MSVNAPAQSPNTLSHTPSICEGAHRAPRHAQARQIRAAHITTSTPPTNPTPLGANCVRFNEICPFSPMTCLHHANSQHYPSTLSCCASVKKASPLWGLLFGSVAALRLAALSVRGAALAFGSVAGASLGSLLVRSLRSLIAIAMCGPCFASPGRVAISSKYTSEGGWGRAAGGSLSLVPPPKRICPACFWGQGRRRSSPSCRLLWVATALVLNFARPLGKASFAAYLRPYVIVAGVGLHIRKAARNH